jgi:c-di-GMP-binding flagellar brake protein YcgR
MEEVGEYRVAREELAQALLAAQRLSLRPGETPRMALRVARVLQVDLKWSSGSVRAVTFDLGVGGIAVLLEKELQVGEHVDYTLWLGEGTAIAGSARVVGVRKQSMNARVSFQFEKLRDGDRDRLEIVIFDTVLDQMKI